jgi:peroxiredoxin
MTMTTNAPQSAPAPAAPTETRAQPARRWLNGWLLAALAVLVLGGAWTWLSRVPAGEVPADRTAQPAVGYPAPDFTLATLDGGEFSLAAQRGTPLVVNFWATWCGPCEREIPTLQAASERYGDRVQIVGVDQGESAETVRAFAEEYGMTFPIPLDMDGAVGWDFNVQGLPTSFFIDGDGVIRKIWAGELNSVTLAEGIQELLE